MFENLLLKVLERIADEIGGKTASLVLDKKKWDERTSIKFFRSLRGFEETMRELGDLLGQEFDKKDQEALIPLPQEFFVSDGLASRLRDSLLEAQWAFRQIDHQIEIYGSRREMEVLHDLLHSDAAMLNLILIGKDKRPRAEWKEAIDQTRLAADRARAIVSAFISRNFPLQDQ